MFLELGRVIGGRNPSARSENGHENADDSEVYREKGKSNTLRMGSNLPMLT
jgi:hypothetical protein